MSSLDSSAEIYIKEELAADYKRYTAPFYINKSASYSAYAKIDDKESKPVQAAYFKT